MLNKTTVSVSENDVRIVQLAVLAIGIHVLEMALPSPIPGIKPGLANVITIAVFFLLGVRAAIWVSVLRVLGGSLLSGTFFSPTFFLSATGALCSLLVLLAVAYWHKNWAQTGTWQLSPFGLSVAAAMAHMAGQFMLAYQWFVPHPGLLNLLPVLMTFALIFGMVSGKLSDLLVQRIKQK